MYRNLFFYLIILSIINIKTLASNYFYYVNFNLIYHYLIPVLHSKVATYYDYHLSHSAFISFKLQRSQTAASLYVINDCLLKIPHEQVTVAE